MMPANAAIFCIDNAYDAKGQKLGRLVAGEQFLSGFARHAPVDTLYLYAATQAKFDAFRERVLNAATAARTVEWIPFNRPVALSKPGCLYIPTPLISKHAWLRRYGDRRGYSICGVNHTLSESFLPIELQAYLLGPLESWDALICTSAASKSVIERILLSWSDYIEDQFELRIESPVQLPVIPLGVDADAFRFSPDDRKRQRENLGIADEDVAVLFRGRLSSRNKSNPIPMYTAIEMAVRRTGRRIHLIQAGQFDRIDTAKEYTEGARSHCPSANVTIVDEGRNSAGMIWAAADIFTSLADNIQETFGRTPIEAMASGLPVVVSDWDGYRETVRHEVDGFRIPTALPASGHGTDLALLYAAGLDDHESFVGRVSQCTSVDVQSAAAAYTRLIEDAELRKRMGASGRRHVEETYDWRHIIASYFALWEELAARREKDGTRGRNVGDGGASPLFPEPFATFGDYASTGILPSSVVAAVPGAVRSAMIGLSESPLNAYAAATLSPIDDRALVLEYLTECGESDVATVLVQVPENRRRLLHRTLGWLAKMNLIRIDTDGPRDL